MIKVFLCDDHALIRRGIRDTLSDAPDIEVVGEAGDYGELRALMREKSADVLVLDINLPGRSGLDVLHALKDEGTAMRVLVVSMYPEDQYAIRALRAGAFGYVNKGGDPALIVSAVRTVAQGRKYVTPEIAQMLVESLTTPSVENAHDKLSDREMQTLVMIASGKRLSDIAEELMLSPKTVSVYRARVLEKLGLANNSGDDGLRDPARGWSATRPRAPGRRLSASRAGARSRRRRRRRAGAPLRCDFPEHGAEALHDLVLRRVRRAEAGDQRVERRADSGGLVDGDLLADRQVHRQVQERVLAAGARPDSVAARAASASARSAAYSGCASIQSAAIVSSGVSGRPSPRFRRASTKKSRTSSAEGANMTRLSGDPSAATNAADETRGAASRVAHKNSRLPRSERRSTAAAMKVDTEQLFDRARTHNGFTAEPVSDAAAAPHLRPDEVGADLGQQLAGADRLRSLGRGQGRSCSAASRRATSRRRARRR